MDMSTQSTLASILSLPYCYAIDIMMQLTSTIKLYAAGYTEEVIK